MKMNMQTSSRMKEFSGQDICDFCSDYIIRLLSNNYNRFTARDFDEKLRVFAGMHYGDKCLGVANAFFNHVDMKWIDGYYEVPISLKYCIFSTLYNRHGDAPFSVERLHFVIKDRKTVKKYQDTVLDIMKNLVGVEARFITDYWDDNETILHSPFQFENDILVQSWPEPADYLENIICVDSEMMSYFKKFYKIS